MDVQPETNAKLKAIQKRRRRTIVQDLLFIALAVGFAALIAWAAVSSYDEDGGAAAVCVLLLFLAAAFVLADAALFVFLREIGCAFSGLRMIRKGVVPPPTPVTEEVNQNRSGSAGRLIAEILDALTPYKPFDFDQDGIISEDDAIKSAIWIAMEEEIADEMTRNRK